ncbi:MAG: heme exporter protein CcmB [Proteobacteria bacterium]|nr:heme exporter protein CcmB [Pseudomonadota bacterium]MDA1059400.1 heme exporter protein CcmB [Pseudomonadota bacterium]
MREFWALVRRDLVLARRQGSAATSVAVFFILTVTLFPLGVGPESDLLGRIASGVIWVAALLATMLSLDRLYQGDYEDGSLDLIALSPLPLELVSLAKTLAHWLTTGLLLVLLSPLLGVLMQLEGSAYLTLVAAMALGTPSLSLFGSIGAALTVGMKRGGVLVSLLVIPLFIPVLIFGVGAVGAAADGLSQRPHLLILGAIFMFSLVLSPVASAAALRLNLE